MSENGHEYRYGYTEIAAACFSLDSRVDPENEQETIDGVIASYDIDPEGLTAAGMQRSLRILAGNTLPEIVKTTGGIALPASIGAAWMDGFMAALCLLQAAQVDTGER